MRIDAELEPGFGAATCFSAQPWSRPIMKVLVIQNHKDAGVALDRSRYLRFARFIRENTVMAQRELPPVSRSRRPVGSKTSNEKTSSSKAWWQS